MQIILHPGSLFQSTHVNATGNPFRDCIYSRSHAGHPVSSLRTLFEYKGLYDSVHYACKPTQQSVDRHPMQGTCARCTIVPRKRLRGSGSGPLFGGLASPFIVLFITIIIIIGPLFTILFTVLICLLLCFLRPFLCFLLSFEGGSGLLLLQLFFCFLFPLSFLGSFA